MIYGYLRITDQTHDRIVREMEHALRVFAGIHGFCLAATFYDDQPGCYSGFDDLLCELRRTGAHGVVTPSVAHLSNHPLLQETMLEQLRFQNRAQVWQASLSHPHLPRRRVFLDRADDRPATGVPSPPAAPSSCLIRLRM